MSASIPGNRELPVSQHNLTTYWGRVRHAADISDPRCALQPELHLNQANDEWVWVGCYWYQQAD